MVPHLLLALAGEPKLGLQRVALGILDFTVLTQPVFDLRKGKILCVRHPGALGQSGQDLGKPDGVLTKQFIGPLVEIIIEAIEEPLFSSGCVEEAGSWAPSPCRAAC